MESSSIDFSNNTPILAYCECAVRVKPLGAGSGDYVQEDEIFGTWRYHGVNLEKKEVYFGDEDPKKKQFTYTFPKFIADGTYTQEMVYDMLLKDHLNHFLNGYNVNFMTYGQTGTGKTYTLLGPIGTFTSYNGNLDEIPENFGILSRLVMSMLQKKGDAILTLCSAQANYKIPFDILTGEEVLMDYTVNEFIGQNEVIINDGASFIKFARLIEKNRACRTTKMNDTSSRSHCYV